MSYFYSYYIGYKKDGKIYPWGPYDASGKLHCVYYRSRSFTSDFHLDFHPVNDEEISDELRKEFEYEDWNGNKVVNVKYLPTSELPDDNYIKDGYYLINDVQAYQNNREEYDNFDGFYDRITPDVYAAKVHNELTFGKNQPKKDAEGEEYTEPNASDYMYHAFPDYYSREYESFMLRLMLSSLDEYEFAKDIDGYVILMTEG